MPCRRVLHRGKTGRAMFFPFVHTDVEFERSFTDILGQQSCCTIKHLTTCWPNNICAFCMDHFSMRSIYVGRAFPGSVSHVTLLHRATAQQPVHGSGLREDARTAPWNSVSATLLCYEKGVYSLSSVTNLQEAVSSHPVTTLRIFDKGTTRKCKQTNKQTKTFEEY